MLTCPFIAYTFSKDLAGAFNKSFPSVIMLQAHGMAGAGISLTTSKGSRQIVNIGNSETPINKDLMLKSSEYMALSSSCTTALLDLVLSFAVEHMQLHQQYVQLQAKYKEMTEAGRRRRKKTQKRRRSRQS